MAQSTNLLLDIIKTLPPSVMKFDGRPLFGYAPPFPWEQFSAVAGQFFQIEDLKIEPTDTQWRGENRQLSGLGSGASCLWISLSPLEGAFGWAMPKHDIASLMQMLLTKPPSTVEYLDPDFQYGFYHFLAIQAFSLLNVIDFDRNLSPSVLDKPFKTSSWDPTLCIDVSIHANGKTVAGRAIIPPELLSSWKQRYAEHRQELAYNTSLAQKLLIIAHIVIGKTSLTAEEWSNVHPGDFIMLDYCSYEPDSDKGRATLTIGGKPVYRAKLKQGNLKILESPLFHEANTPMNTPSKEEDFDEASSDQDEGNTPYAGSGKKGFDPLNLPINLIVEAGRLQMSVQQLMEIQPGNLLELDLHPENGVDLVVNGQRIGKGELLKIGEALGVRVLSLG